MDTGVIGGCGALCKELPKELEATICTLLCDYVGINVFEDLISKADLDPIWMCMEMKVCPVHDGGEASIADLIVHPASGPRGTKFEIGIGIDVTKQTGTGQIFLEVDCPMGMPLQGADLTEGFEPGQYSAVFNIDSSKTSQFDEFIPGTYNVTAAVCYGECGSTHSHSAILAQKTTTFEITP
jgi:hypothetical protein